MASATQNANRYDGIVFAKEMAFIAASNPTLNSNGANTVPAVDRIDISSGSIVLTPVLMGDASATNLVTKKATAPRRGR